MKLIKRLYDWVLSWASSKWSGLALFIFAFAESSFFPIPPDVLLIALCLGATSKWAKYATICTVGSVFGAMGGYALGFYAWQTSAGDFTPIAEFFFRIIPGFTVETYNDISRMYEEYNFWMVFTGGFTPIPYKLITITAGVFHINFFMFIFASIISRGLRFFLVAGLIWKFGPPIKVFIEKYFNILAIAFTILLIGSFIAIKYLIP